MLYKGPDGFNWKLSYNSVSATNSTSFNNRMNIQDKFSIKLGHFGAYEITCVYLYIPEEGNPYLQINYPMKKIQQLPKRDNIFFLYIGDSVFITAVDTEHLRNMGHDIEAFDGYTKLKSIDEAIEEYIIGELSKE